MTMTLIGRVLAGALAVLASQTLRAVPQNVALNIGISGDRTEHLLIRILPKAQGRVASGNWTPQSWHLSSSC